MENKITSGIIWKQLLIFFLPIVFGSLFQQIYGMADTIIVGREIGKTALAAVGGSASRITDLLVGFFVGLSSGASVVLGQYYGAKNYEKARITTYTSLAFSILSGMLIMIVGVMFASQMLTMLSTPIDTMQGAKTYLIIYFLGSIFNLLYNMSSALLRAMGDSKRPLYVLIFTCVLNIVLDVIFVVVFKFGIAGVAIATISCQFISATITTYMLIQFQNLTIKQVKMDMNNLKHILRIGVPAALESLTYSITNSFIQIYINILGTNTIAAWTTAGKIDAFFWMILSAFSISTTTFVAQNYGANQPDRVRQSIKIGFILSVICCGVVAVLILTNLDFIYGLFTSDKAVATIGKQIEYFLMPTYILFIIISILSGALRGIGDVLIPLILSCGGVCSIRIIWLLFAFHRWPTLNVVMTSYPLSYLFTAILFIIYARNKFPGVVQ